MRFTNYFLVLAVAGVFQATAADGTISRLGRATAVFNSLTTAKNGIRAEQIAAADCIAVIPGFKKGAAVVGVGYGRGFISCRDGGKWSAPGAVSLETGSLGVQIGGEQIDIVVLSMDMEQRAKLLSGRFAIGSDASAAWGNGKAAHEDSNAKILFFGQTKGMFAGFGLDGATLATDESGNKALYGKASTNREIVSGGTETPVNAQAFIARLSSVTNP